MKSTANPLGLGPVKIINEMYELKSLEDMNNPIAVRHPFVTVPSPVAVPEQKTMDALNALNTANALEGDKTRADDALICLCCMQFCMCCIW